MKKIIVLIVLLLFIIQTVSAIYTKEVTNDIDCYGNYKVKVEGDIPIVKWYELDNCQNTNYSYWLCPCSNQNLTLIVNDSKAYVYDFTIEYYYDNPRITNTMTQDEINNQKDTYRRTKKIGDVIVKKPIRESINLNKKIIGTIVIIVIIIIAGIVIYVFKMFSKENRKKENDFFGSNKVFKNDKVIDEDVEKFLENLENRKRGL